MSRQPTSSSQLFNSALETGTRSVLLLYAARPRAFDLTHLTWLDHLVVHTSDLDGPPSLHPDIPQRNGELIVRRANVEEGLLLMRRLHLIKANYSSDGISYVATEEADLFVQLVRSSYGRSLRERAEWLVDYVCTADTEFLAQLISDKVGRWSVEFQSEKIMQ